MRYTANNLFMPMLSFLKLLFFYCAIVCFNKVNILKQFNFSFKIQAPPFYWGRLYFICANC
jgi:hypothetical protein